jgi:hypothetical protein
VVSATDPSKLIIGNYFMKMDGEWRIVPVVGSCINMFNLQVLTKFA